MYQVDLEDFDNDHYLMALTNQKEERDSRRLLVFQGPDEVVLAFLFYDDLKLGSEVDLEPGTVQVFWSSRKYDIRETFVVPKDFYYDLTPERLQIYRQANFFPPQSLISNSLMIFKILGTDQHKAPSSGSG